MVAALARCHGPGAEVFFAMVLWLEVAIVGGIFGIGVARESESALVKFCGTLMPFSFPLIPIVALFSYAVARESDSPRVQWSGLLLAALIPVCLVLGTLLEKAQLPAWLGGLGWSACLLLWGFFTWSVARESGSRLVRTPGILLAATMAVVVPLGWLLFVMGV
jgi:hypothetical protein